MGLIEDLKTLEELHAKGRLSDGEFAAAKASAISGSTQSFSAAAVASPALESVTPEQKKVSAARWAWRLVGIVILFWLLWVYFGRPTTTTIKEIANLPADLKSDSFGLPAASWKSIVIDVPYNGALTISVQVTGGNPVRVFLTDNAGLQTFREDTDGRIRYFDGFYSDKTRSFDHSGRIPRGRYQLVIYDPTYGILSSSSSDVSLKAHIDP